MSFLGVDFVDVLYNLFGLCVTHPKFSILSFLLSFLGFGQHDLLSLLKDVPFLY